MKEGRFADEIVAVPIPQRKGDPIVVDTDEGVRPGTTTESLGRLRPAFAKDGTITAGNASQISDGAAALIVMSRDKAEELGATPHRRARRLRHGRRSRPVAAHPAVAGDQARARPGEPAVSDVDLFELNEAFAAVGLASMRDLGITDDIVNVNGGAIALGHPIGMSGARIVVSIINELRRRGGGLGAAALCGGGGQGDAADRVRDSVGPRPPPTPWPDLVPGRRCADPDSVGPRRPGRIWCQGDAALIRTL